MTNNNFLGTTPVASRLYLTAYDEHVWIIPGARACDVCEALGPLGCQGPEFHYCAQALPAGLDVYPVAPQIAVLLQLLIGRLQSAYA